MNDARLAELKEKYKDRNLLEELAWGAYACHMGYTSKQNGEFLNWLCMMAYMALKERPEGKWIFEKADNESTDGYICSNCGCSYHTKVPYFSEYNFCPNCGAKMQKGGEDHD